METGQLCTKKCEEEEELGAESKGQTDFTGTKILCQLCQDADQTERLDPSEPSTDQQQGSDSEHLRKKLLFEERRRLVAKWFDRWSDRQRKEVLQDFVLNCSVDQLRFLSLSVSRQLPLQAADFTCLLPRALCLYLFSFLDPRSLCRCAQVSWHWKSIVELDQLWMPKCLRLGWCIDFTPTQFERGVWKRHYIQSVQDLQLSLLQTVSSQRHSIAPDASAVSSGHKELVEVDYIRKEQPASPIQTRVPSSGSRFRKQKEAAVLPPWRDSDRHPRDTIRFNYLDNLDPIEQALSDHRRSRASSCRSSTSKMDIGRRKTPTEATYKLRKAKSLMLLSSSCNPHSSSSSPLPLHDRTPNRPLWASRSENHLITVETAKSVLGLAQWNAGIRPRPVRTPMPQVSAEALAAFRRSHRSVPSTPLFEVHPWTAQKNQDVLPPGGERRQYST